MDALTLYCGATWVWRGVMDPSQTANQKAETNDCASDECNKESSMMDILMSALALVFFAAAIGYTYACERL
jgi:hypothetical protein